MPRRADFDLGAIKTDLEFIMERLSNLPTRREVALRPAFSHRRECRTRHRLDRAFPTRLPIGSIMIGRHARLATAYGWQGIGLPQQVARGSWLVEREPLPPPKKDSQFATLSRQTWTNWNAVVFEKRPSLR
jgi:hypothetical protein